MKEKNPEKWLLKQTKAEATSCFIVGALEDHSTLADFAEYNHVVWFIEEERLPKESTRYQNVYPMTLESIDKAKVDEIIHVLSEENMIYTPDIFCTEHILENYTASYDFIIKKIQIFTSNKRIGINTHMFHGYISQKNIIPNIPNFIKHKVCDSFENSYQGLPAAIIGAGPSLNVTIKQLKKYHEKMIIFCTDSAATTVHEAGITPDAILTVDVTKTPEKYFNSDQRVNSLFLSLKSPLDWTNFESSKIHFLSGSNLADTFLDSNGIKQTKCKIVGNCGVTALNLSIFLGCSPIILFGMDHAADDSGNLWTGKKNDMHISLAKKVKDNSAAWTTVEGNYSRAIKSYSAHELEVFHQIASSTSPDQEIWNINDRGAKVKNTKLIHPDEFSFDSRNLSKEKSINLKTDSFDPKAVKKLWSGIGKSLKKNKSTIKKLKNCKSLDDNELCMYLALLFKDKNIFNLCGNFSLKVSPMIVKWDELPEGIKDQICIETEDILDSIQSLHSSLLKMNTE